MKKIRDFSFLIFGNSVMVAFASKCTFTNVINITSQKNISRLCFLFSCSEILQYRTAAEHTVKEAVASGGPQVVPDLSHSVM